MIKKIINVIAAILALHGCVQAEQLSSKAGYETTLSVKYPGAVIYLSQLSGGYSYLVNSPGGILDIFATGTTQHNNVYVRANNSAIFNLTSFMGKNEGIRLTARQITIYYNGSLPYQTDVVFYVRDVNLYGSVFPGAVYMISTQTVDINVPAYAAESTFTIIATRTNYENSYSMTFSGFKTSESKSTRVIPGVYQNPSQTELEDITLLSFSSQDSYRWDLVSVYQRIITFIAPARSSYRFTVDALQAPSKSRNIWNSKSDVISSKYYPTPQYYVQQKENYTIYYEAGKNKKNKITFHLVKAEVPSPGKLEITSFPNNKKKVISGTVRDQTFKMEGESMRVEYTAAGVGESGFLLQYSRGSMLTEMKFSTIVILLLAVNILHTNWRFL